MRRRTVMLGIAVAAVALAAAACGTSTSPTLVPGGDPANGKRLIQRFGCGSCHEIAGIEGAGGRVGPSLRDLQDRRLIAGRIGNNPRNAIRWIMDPQRIEPGTVMPDLGVTEPEARDIAAYLYAH